MRYVGRIITTSKIDGISDFIEVTKDASSVKNNDAKIPTLIIGYKNAESICGKGIKMLDKKIGENLYWTFSKRERRTDYDNDINKFLTIVSDFVAKYCKYEYVDLITAGDCKRNEFSDLLRDKTYKKVIYTTNSMHYIYSSKNNKIYGISKDVLKFLGRDSELANYSGISSNGSFFLVNDHEFSETKITKSKFVLPLLYYIKNF